MFDTIIRLVRTALFGQCPRRQPIAVRADRKRSVLGRR